MIKEIAVVVGTASLLLNPVKTEFSEVNVPYQIEEYTEFVAGWYGCSKHLLQAMIYSESSFDSSAKNGHCIGLMQVDERFHQERAEKFGLTDLEDAYTNILVGTDYLMELAEESGYTDISYVLDKYNGNASAKANYEAGIISPYASKVLRLAEVLEGMEYDFSL